MIHQYIYSKKPWQSSISEFLTSLKSTLIFAIKSCCFVAIGTNMHLHII